MKRAIIGLTALLIAMTAIAATQYVRVQLTGQVTLSHQFKDVQFVSHDFAPEAPIAPCAATANRALCSDGAGVFVFNGGTWTLNDVKVFSGAFGIANAELGALTINQILCVDSGGGTIDICGFMRISLHPSANEWCYAPAGPWQPATLPGDAGCVTMWDFAAGSTGFTWIMAAACPTCAFPTGYIGANLVYGDSGAGPVYASTYDGGNDNTWESVGGNQDATAAGTNHVWVEVALDFTGVGAPNDGANAFTLYVTGNTVGP